MTDPDPREADAGGLQGKPVRSANSFSRKEDGVFLRILSGLRHGELHEEVCYRDVRQ